MTPNHPSTGADISADLFRAQRLAEAGAAQHVGSHFAIALDIIEHMDEHDSADRDFALVIWHCTKALCTALDART